MVKPLPVDKKSALLYDAKDHYCSAMTTAERCDPTGDDEVRLSDDTWFRKVVRDGGIS